MRSRTMTAYSHPRVSWSAAAPSFAASTSNGSRRRAATRSVRIASSSSTTNTRGLPPSMLSRMQLKHQDPHGARVESFEGEQTDRRYQVLDVERLEDDCLYQRSVDLHEERRISGCDHDDLQRWQFLGLHKVEYVEARPIREDEIEHKNLV